MCRLGYTYGQFFQFSGEKLDQPAGSGSALVGRVLVEQPGFTTSGTQWCDASIVTWYLYIGNFNVLLKRCCDELFLYHSSGRNFCTKTFYIKIDLFSNKLNSSCVRHSIDLQSTNMTKAKNTVKVSNPDIRIVWLMCKLKILFASCNDPCDSANWVLKQSCL